jgi:hypothetical protein
MLFSRSSAIRTASCLLFFRELRQVTASLDEHVCSSTEVAAAMGQVGRIINYAVKLLNLTGRIIDYREILTRKSDNVCVNVRI